MTAPIKNRFDVDAVDSRDQAAKQVPSAEANNLAIERVTHLHNEIFARGVFARALSQR